MNEAWMANRLELPLSWAAGVTTAEQRREAIRTAILQQQRALTIAGKRKGKACETWKALFERTYRTSLNKAET
jgi:hypothetical protein